MGFPLDSRRALNIKLRNSINLAFAPQSIHLFPPPLAYETLSDPTRRRVYDSSLPFDDSIPDDDEGTGSNPDRAVLPFLRFGPLFLLLCDLFPDVGACA